MARKEKLREIFLFVGSSVQGQAKLSVHMLWNPGRSARSHWLSVRNLYIFIPPHGPHPLSAISSILPPNLQSNMFYLHCQCLLGEKCIVLPIRAAEVLSNQCVSLVLQKRALPVFSNFSSLFSLIFLLYYLDSSHSAFSWRLPFVLLYYRQKKKYTVVPSYSWEVRSKTPS